MNRWCVVVCAALLGAAAQGADPVTLEGHTGGVNAVNFSPDGKYLASGGWDRSVKVWDVAARRSRTLGNHVMYIVAVAYAPDGTALVSVAGDQTRGEVKMWEAATGAVRWGTDKGLAGANDVAVSPDGKLVAVAAGGARVAKILSAATGRELGELVGHEGQVLSVKFSPDGKTIATGGSDGTVRLWATETQTQSAAVTWGLPGPKAAFVVAFTPDGKTVAAGCDDGRVQFWDARTANPLAELVAHRAPISGLVFSPDGKSLATAGFRDPAREGKTWGSEWFTPTAALTGHKVFISGLAFSPRGDRIATASADGTIKLWQP